MGDQNYQPPCNTVGKFLRDEYFADYVHPRDWWAQENSETKMPTWMLNILAIDAKAEIDGGASLSKRKKKKKSNAELHREVEMWKGRAGHTFTLSAMGEKSAGGGGTGSKRNHDKEVKENKSLTKRHLS